MDSAILDRASEQYLGEWKRLVSTTNWDKGRIIQAWRQELIAAGASPAEFADETWSRQVGNVTPQHVGRLRRVYERFSQVRDSYGGLFWSHFQAALDWEDAEMWLEGALQNDWSISQMRATRAEALGHVGESFDNAADETAEVDEDAEAEPAGRSDDAVDSAMEIVRPAHKSSTAEEDADTEDWSTEFDGEGSDDTVDSEPAEPVRPFAHLASLPADVSEAFEAFKLCILKHKLAGWAELAREDMLAALDGLKELALAPA